MTTSFRTLGPAVAVLACAASASLIAAPAENVNHARVELLADTTTVVPGQPITVALHFKIDEGWHLYHRESGDSGEPPRVKWTLPEGFSAGDLRFPPSKPHKTATGTDNVYYTEVALLATITPPASLDTTKPVELKATVRWLACDADICLPERAPAPLVLSMPVGASPVPAHEEQFKKWKSLAEPEAPTTAPAR
jgi:DsbC/DsbD-like thiol-disulfide interchange protein